MDKNRFLRPHFLFLPKKLKSYNLTFFPYIGFVDMLKSESSVIKNTFSIFKIPFRESFILNVLDIF